MNKIKDVLIVGGSNGLGMALSLYFIRHGKKVIIVDNVKPDFSSQNVTFKKTNLVNNEYTFLRNDLREVNCVIITAGIGRLTYFENITPDEIDMNFKINTIPTIKLVNHFYSKIKLKENFYFCSISSIAGQLNSPLYALYSATKSAISKFIESLNCELECQNINNRILDVQPGKLEGTMFHGKENHPEMLEEIVNNIINHLLSRKELYIPYYDEIYKKVIYDYKNDKKHFGKMSYEYKIGNSQLQNNAKYRVGYLSGTFDLFHVGHLNILKKAKEYCDYLIVGIHPFGAKKNKKVAIPYNERYQILESIKYVDKVVEALPEDSDAYYLYKYRYLFVGSDYKGSERFNNYERLLKDYGVEIIYFEYTNSTSSTMLRDYLSNNK